MAGNVGATAAPAVKYEKEGWGHAVAHNRRCRLGAHIKRHPYNRRRYMGNARLVRPQICGLHKPQAEPIDEPLPERPFPLQNQWISGLVGVAKQVERTTRRK